MKYFIDFEFIEGFHKPFLGKRRHFIDLISVGIVAEDSREYYAISKEFNAKNADEWVRENVISKLPDRVNLTDPSVSPRLKQESMAWRSNKQIAEDIIRFCDSAMFLHNNAEPDLEFYGYYSDYDWVLFCSLFGRMIDLPKGFPMYCIDLKQILDEKAASMNEIGINMFTYDEKGNEIKKDLHNDVMDISKYSLDKKIQILKVQPTYPKQTNEHNALADAKWNYELYKFLLKQ